MHKVKSGTRLKLYAWLRHRCVCHTLLWMGSSEWENPLESTETCMSFTSNVVNIKVPYGKPIEEVYDGAHDGCMLEPGETGTVRKVTH